MVGICIVCSAEFQSSRTGRVTCGGAACQQELGRRRAREYQARKRAGEQAERAKRPPLTPVACDVCGDLFSPPHRAPWQKRHAECQAEHERRRSRDGRASGRHAPSYKPKGPWRGERVCRFCGEVFEARSSRATVCYSDDCQREKNNERMRGYFRAWRESHGITYQHAKYPERRRAHADARKALVRGASGAEPVERGAIFERDGWVCGLCGKSIDPGLVFPHPLSATVDHIVPLSAGGAHSPENVQAAHLTCNARKGNRG